MFIPLCVLSILNATPDVQDKPQTPPPFYSKTLDAEATAWVEKTLNDLTVEELVSQLAMDWTSGAYEPIKGDVFQEQIGFAENGMGGLWIMFGHPHSTAVRINELQKHARVPLLVFGLARLGVQSQNGGTDFPSAMAYSAIGDEETIREAAKHLGLESRAMGGHILGDDGNGNLLTDLKNVLGNRTLSDDPQVASILTAACLVGANEGGAIEALGFWPGVGSIASDPHIALPVLHETKEEFETEDYLPFRAAIAAGVDCIMTSHIAAPSLSGSETLPTTLSPKIVNILREDLNYDGVLMTDAMAMGGITNNYDFVEASVMAFQAGHDIILGPNVPGFKKLMLEKIEGGEISMEKVRISVRRILRLKAKLGLHKNRFVDMNEIHSVVGKKEHQDAADSAAERSITLLRDEESLVPLPAGKNVLSITYERVDNKEAGGAFNGTLRGSVASLEPARVSPQSDTAAFDDLFEKAKNVDQVVLSVYIRPQLYAAEFAAVSEELLTFVKQLREADIDVVVISFGKLAILDSLPGTETLLMAWSPQKVMQRAAAKALLGQTAIGGKLPINLKPHHERGEGLTRAALQPIGRT
jgi:beta-N-acetylhexosaminidase